MTQQFTPEEIARKRAAIRRVLDRKNRDVPGPFGCKCQTLHHRMTGDGCEICNPELAAELESDKD